MVGASLKPERASNSVGLYMADAGYRVIPVNPSCVGERLFGEIVRADLSDIKSPVDLLSVFRRSEQVLPHVEEAISDLLGLKRSGCSSAFRTPRRANAQNKLGFRSSKTAASELNTAA